MLLEGSCACGAVTFTVETPAPYPYCRCYCPDCRKTTGSGGFASWMVANADSLQVTGDDQLAKYHGECPDGHETPGARHFCRKCGSHLWFFDPRWPDDLHPFASAIDTPLPLPPKYVEYNLAHIAPWVPRPEAGPAHELCDGSYTVGMKEWHRRNGLAED
ncbi:MAG: alanine acetyltransferase [Rhodospirillales bacterium CG15_BIG_FIL_POST_REV_8_21_14_020_66_15]|nr:MAG: alanine acetyltransferase [Rhodospirillales bacterium CG15_BIG_FIL_POST_REV_8_21_14_020_66_15]